MTRSIKKELLDFTIPFEITKKELAALLKTNTLSHCQTLLFEGDVDNLSPALLKRLFQKTDFTNLRSLDVAWVLSNPSPYCKKLSAILQGILNNPSFKNLQTLDYCIFNHDYKFLPELLKLKAAPHLSQQIRDSIDLKCGLDGFSWTVTKAVELMCNSPELEMMRTLDFSKKPFNDEAAEILAKCPYLGNLQSLNLSRTSLTDEGVIALARSHKLKNLQEIKLGYVTLTHKAAQVLADSPYLSKKSTRAWQRKANKLKNS